jgi:hypothetical protein
MKHLLVSVCIGLLLFGCGQIKQPSKHITFRSIDFSYSDVFSTCFSIKFNQGDTVFIRQYFTSSYSGVLKRNTTYYSVLNKQDRNSVDSFVDKIDFLKYQDRYLEAIQDGVMYALCIENDSIKKTIVVHSDTAPGQLNRFADWLADFKTRLKIVPLDTTMVFTTSKFVVLPQIPPPPVIFKHARRQKVN